MTDLVTNKDSINATVPDFTIPLFQKTSYATLINTLWLLSLDIALITASVGILVKQWFHELLSYDTHDPMERLKLRFFREAGVERWKVFAIASCLPLLLQLALLFFFIGLVLFLHPLDAVVAWSTTGVVVLWLVVLLLTTAAPVFSSQCPYKTPFLKNTISRLRNRMIPWPSSLTGWILLKVSGKWFPDLKRQVDKLDDFFIARRRTWGLLEENCVCKDGALSLPVISFTRDLLQGERLSDSVVECVEGIPVDDVKETICQIGLWSSPIHCMLPSARHGLAGVVGLSALEILHDDHLQPIYLDEEICPSVYLGSTQLQSKAYTPCDYVLPSRSLFVYIRLIQANPVSAAFSLLAMYSIRCRALVDYPGVFEPLFPWLSNAETRCHSKGTFIV